MCRALYTLPGMRRQVRHSPCPWGLSVMEQCSYIQSDMTCLRRCCGNTEESRPVFSTEVVPDLNLEGQAGISQASKRWKGGIVGRGSMYQGIKVRLYMVPLELDRSQRLCIHAWVAGFYSRVLRETRESSLHFRMIILAAGSKQSGERLVG